MNVSTENKIIDLENRLVAALGEREGVGGIGSLGLMDANYCSCNGFTMRSCCVALGTMSRCLYRNMTMGEKSMYTCTCNLVPMLYSGKKIKKKFFLQFASWTLISLGSFLLHQLLLSILITLTLDGRAGGASGFDPQALLHLDSLPR